MSFFLDIRKAFDSVDHSILQEKVQFYAVADRELMWFKSYLIARQQQCLINVINAYLPKVTYSVEFPKALFLAFSFSLSTKIESHLVEKAGKLQSCSYRR